MPPKVQIAVSAFLVEELGDLREQLETMPKPAPAIDYSLLADFVMTRIGPRLQLLEERAAQLETSLAGVGGQFSLVARQQESIRRRLRR
jgi:hypothetical protein